MTTGPSLLQNVGFWVIGGNIKGTGGINGDVD